MLTIQSEITRLIGVQLEKLPKDISVMRANMQAVTKFLSSLTGLEDKLRRFLLNNCQNDENCGALIVCGPLHSYSFY